MGVAALVALGQGADAARRFSGHPLAAQLAAMTMATVHGPRTSSMGRLFDAVAALLGVCEIQSFEGQAAMELEALVSAPSLLAGGFRMDQGVLDFSPLLSAMGAPGLEARKGAAQFHGTVIAGLAEWIFQYAQQVGRTDVVLGGGCFMNRVLTEGLTRALRRRGLTPWIGRAAPGNDGGISLGQAAAARAYLMTDRQPWR